MKINLDTTKFEDALKSFDFKKTDGAKKILQSAILKTQIEALRDAPNFVSIDVNFKDGGTTGEVYVIGKQEAEMSKSDANNMAAYFEFGTGLSAQQILAPYPQWVKDIAMEYYVTGEGTLVGKPYLFNNFLRNLETFESEMKKLIEG